MISSKQRAWLRSRANTIDADFHVGKEPWNPAMADSLAELLSTHELVKAVVSRAPRSRCVRSPQRRPNRSAPTSSR
jgi:RNA-binding protein YhbY